MYNLIAKYEPTKWYIQYIMIRSEAKTGVNAKTRTWRALNTKGLGLYLVSKGELLKFWEYLIYALQNSNKNKNRLEREAKKTVN